MKKSHFNTWTVKTALVIFCGFSGFACVDTEFSPVQDPSSNTVADNRLRLQKISAGTDFTCAIDVAGVPYCWGRDYNDYRPEFEQSVFGKLGNVNMYYVCDDLQARRNMCIGGFCNPAPAHCDYIDGEGRQVNKEAYQTRVGQPSPVNNANIEGDKKFVQISAAENHACALTSDGTAYCWGDNLAGQLGIGSADSYGNKKGENWQTEKAFLPVKVDMSEVEGGKFKQISAGFTYSCAISIGGKLYCWGLDKTGEDSETDPLLRWKIVMRPAPVDVSRIAGEQKFVKVELGSVDGICALSELSKVYCWGSDTDKAIFGDNDYKFGYLPKDSLFMPESADESDRSLIDIQTASGKTCALTSSGKLICWELGKTGEGYALSPEGERYTKLSTYKSHVCAITDSGGLYCWGPNEYGQVGDGQHDLYELGDFPSIGMQRVSLSPTRVITSSIIDSRKFVEVSAGYAHSCAIADDGLAYCWGTNLDHHVWHFETNENGSLKGLASVDYAPDMRLTPQLIGGE